MSALTQRAQPIVDADSRPFWEGCARGELLAQQCEYCRAWRWPPMAFCPSCHRPGGIWTTLPGTGRIGSFVVVERSLDPSLADELPLVVAMVQVDGTEGAVVLRSNLIDCDAGAVAVGLRVTATFRNIAGSLALPLFRPSTGGNHR
jgi:uncharacterized OB-fold protein